jgi:hypothetical protein
LYDCFLELFLAKVRIFLQIASGKKRKNHQKNSDGFFSLVSERNNNKIFAIRFI